MKWMFVLPLFFLVACRTSVSSEVLESREVVSAPEFKHKFMLLKECDVIDVTEHSITRY